jgi:hypothetical protein
MQFYIDYTKLARKLKWKEISNFYEKEKRIYPCGPQNAARATWPTPGKPVRTGDYAIKPPVLSDIMRLL